MKLLNLCCGAVRPQSTEGVEWVNVDNLYATIFPGTPERENLDKEENYRNLDVEKEMLINVFRSNDFDGILASHCVEHWDCQTAAGVLDQCRILLNPRGVLLVSVPDASYFRRVHDRDTAENAPELFGEPIYLPDGEVTFFNYALWNRWHKTILTEDALWAYLVRAGFKEPFRLNKNPPQLLPLLEPYSMSAVDEMTPLLNRLPFSLVLAAVKE